MHTSIQHRVLCLAAFLCVLILFGTVNTAQAAEKTNLENDVTSATLSEGSFSTWLSHPVTVTLQAPSWADATKYHFGGGDFSTYVRPLVVDAEGKTTLYYQSSSAGSIEPLQTAEVWLDYKAPSVPGGVLFSRPQSDGFSYNFGPSKDFMSGVGSYEVTVTSVATSSTVTTETVSGTSGSVSKLAAGTYDFSYAARDLAGNISLPRHSQVMVGLDKPLVTYAFDDPQVAQKVAQGAWITEGVDVRLTAAITSEAPTSTLKLQTISGSLTTTDVAQVNYGSVPLIVSEQGEGRVALSACDLYGNESLESSFTLKVDRTPPPSPVFLEVKTTAAVSDATQRNLSLSWNPVVDAASGLDHYTVTLAHRGDGFAGIVQRDVASPTTVFADIEPGTYDITLQAFDKAGLASAPSTITKTIVATAGTKVALSSGANKSASNASSSSDEDDASNVSESADGATLVADDAVNQTPSGSIDEGSTREENPTEPLLARDASRSNADPDGFLSKALAYLKEEWIVWVPLLLGLITLVIVVVYLIKNHWAKKSTPDPTSGGDESLSSFLGLSDSAASGDVTQKLTAPSARDQAVNYFQINDKN